jgi:hypothetical protein
MEWSECMPMQEVTWYRLTTGACRPKPVKAVISHRSKEGKMVFIKLMEPTGKEITRRVTPESIQKVVCSELS